MHPGRHQVPVSFPAPAALVGPQLCQTTWLSVLNSDSVRSPGLWSLRPSSAPWKFRTYTGVSPPPSAPVADPGEPHDVTASAGRHTVSRHSAAKRRVVEIDTAVGAADRRIGSPSGLCFPDARG